MVNAVEDRLLKAAQVEDAWTLLADICAFEREHPRDVDRSVEIVAERLRSAGVPAQIGTMDLFLSLPGQGSVAAEGVRFLAKPSAMSRAVPDGLTAELVYVPGAKDMIVSLLDPSQDTGGLREKIANRIVLTDGIAGPGVVSSFAPLGALGVIAINPGNDIHSAICTPIWGNPDLRSLGDKPDIPVVSVNRPDGEQLKALAARDGEATIFSALEEGWYPSKYLSVEIPGTVEPEKFVMLHGHIDSWHLGVGDNGTGVVTMFEVARLLWANREHLRRAVRILWWPGHSTGRYAGSTFYADEHALDIEENCVAQVDCDSPGCRWATAYIDLFCMPEAAGFLSQAVSDATGQQAKIMRPLRAGDWSFNNLGVTGLLALSSTMPPEAVAEKGYYRTGGNGGNIEWHTDRDTLDIADRDVLLADIRLYALVTCRLAAAGMLPFDFRANVAEFRETLAAYQDAADGVDLHMAQQACEALGVALDRFHEALSYGEIGPERANEVILGLQRALVPAHFAIAGRFQQDPALDTPPLPAIALCARLKTLPTDKRPFAITQIVRGRNQITAAFRAASRLVETAVWHGGI